MEYKYGSETWPTIKSPVHRVEMFHQRCQGRILRIKWFMKTSNERFLQRAGITNIATSRIIEETVKYK